MSSYGTGSSPYTSSSSAYGKRSISCSNGYAKLSPSSGPKGASTNNNNHFYSRFSTASPGPSVLSPQQSRGGMSNYRTSTTSSYVPNLYGQHKMPSSTSYARNNIFVNSPLSRHREETAGHLRLRSRDLPLSRDLPVKSKYLPDPKDDSGRGYHSGGLLKQNADVNDLSILGLTLSSAGSPSKNLKKSSSHQDMLLVSSTAGGVTTNFSSNRYVTTSNGFNNCMPRALPEFRSSNARKTPLSDLPPAYQATRRSSITRGRSQGTTTVDSNEGTGPSIRPANHSLVADTVARLNRRNEAEKMLSSIGVQQNHPSISARRFSLKDNSGTRESSNNGDSVTTQLLNDELSTSSSSSNTGSPNNNTNNFSKKYVGKGMTGLQNIGNTCFMNCVLQCLSNTRPLLELCLNYDLLNEKNTETSRLKGDLASAYVDLMQSMWKGLDSLSPSNFKYQVSRFARLFVGYNQQDAQEFLMYLLQGLHEDLNRVREKKNKLATRKLQDGSYNDDNMSTSEKAILSWKRHLELENSYIVDLFEGLLKSALKCRSCGYVSNTFDPFLGLSLPIKKVSAGSGDETSLVECLELFTHEEVLDENEKTTCDKCKKKQNSTKRLTIQKFPKILIINLKRFSEESFFRSKLSTPVRCPTKNLDLRKFSDESVGDRAVYSLYGVCNHSGTPMGGHYTALAKNPYSNEWHHFNDQRVASVSENSSLVSSEAYILFYELSSK